MGQDSTLQVDILPVYVFNKKADLRKYRRLVEAVKRVYPLAQIAKQYPDYMTMEYKSR